jgi:hypothetical protein
MKPDEPIPYDVAQMVGRAARARETEAKDLANLRPAHVHIKRDVHNQNDDVNITGRPWGNSAAAAMCRLRKDRPGRMGGLPCAMDEPDDGRLLKDVLGKHGGDRRSEGAKENQVSNVNLKKGGNRRAYTVARLRRDRPDLAERVEADQISANAAAQMGRTIDVYIT